jgi:hypothetical protein
MRRPNLFNPVVMAQEMERWERRCEKKEAGTGCKQCMNSETAWGVTICMLNERHPACVYRGRFRFKEA